VYRSERKESRTGDWDADESRRDAPSPSVAAGASNAGHDIAAVPISRSAPALPQPRLEIGAVDDPAEMEADSAADQVVRRSGPPASASAAAPARVDGASGGESDSVDASVRHATRAGGSPLDATTRAFMEAGFGHDFGHVRIHTGEAAAQSSQDLRADAYTLQSDIVFAQNQYAPHTDDGRWLLAHELAHVVQQSAAKPIS